MWVVAGGCSKCRCAIAESVGSCRDSNQAELTYCMKECLPSSSTRRYVQLQWLTQHLDAAQCTAVATPCWIKRVVANAGAIYKQHTKSRGAQPAPAATPAASPEGKRCPSAPAAGGGAAAQVPTLLLCISPHHEVGLSHISHVMCNATLLSPSVRGGNGRDALCVCVCG